EGRPDQPDHRPGVSGAVDRSRQPGGPVDGRRTLPQRVSREPADWRLGGDVAPARGVPLRLVADPERSALVRSAARHGGTNRAANRLIAGYCVSLIWSDSI